MSKRNSVVVLVFLAFALGTLSLFSSVITAQKGSNTTTIAKASQLSLRNPTAAAITVPVPGAPLRGIDVKLGKTPGGNASTRTTGLDGKIPLGDLAPGSYWMEIVPMTAAQKAANAAGETYSYVAVTITGTQLVGGTKTRSASVENWKFEEPPVATARRVPLPATFAARIVFEIAPNKTGGPPPVPVFTSLSKSRSNVKNND